jgi:hypothetical protein
MLLSMLIQMFPWAVTAAVMMGIALVGWRRTRATGALLIAVAGGLQILDSFVGAWSMSALMERHSGFATAGLYGLLRTVGHLTSSTLFIVGVALLIKRLPTVQPRA